MRMVGKPTNHLQDANILRKLLQNRFTSGRVELINRTGDRHQNRNQLTFDINVPVLSILFKPFGFIAAKTLNYLTLQTPDFEPT
jgi:hypothetical protein